MKTFENPDTPARIDRQASAPERSMRDTPGTPVTDRRAAASALRGFQALADSSPRAMQLKRQAELAGPGPARAAKANDTGLPDQLKSGIETLSGMSMDHVKVHYNSARPAQLQAHAFAQGSDIHLAPGQERHLAHEAWHVVQQAQGRVRPTAQLKGIVALNDDAGLEAEADAMAARIAGMGPVQGQRALRPGSAANGAVAQRVVSVSTLKYIPTGTSLALITALNNQIATAETDAEADVRNAAKATPHSKYQASYMRTPNARGWGYCVEEKLNVWATNNGWTISNLGGDSNPDYSRMDGTTKVWADLTTVAEAGAGGSHVIDKLERKVNKGAIDTGWVAADLLHAGHNPLSTGPRIAPVTKGTVTALHNRAWQAYRSFKRGDVYDHMIDLRSKYVPLLPSYATYTQSWTADERDVFSRWINGDNDHRLGRNLDDDLSSDDEEEERPKKRKATKTKAKKNNKKVKRL